VGPIDQLGREGDEHPPPTPFERAAATSDGAPLPAAQMPPRGLVSRRGRGIAIAGATILTVVLVASLVAAVGTGRVELPGRGGAEDGAADDAVGTPAPTREAALLRLLEDVDAAEQVMLAFNEEAGEVVGGATELSEVLVGIAAAAAEAGGLLEEPRASIVAMEGDRVLDAVRAAYLPHLDAWADHLALLVDAPDALFDEDRLRPSILLINATAVVFAQALEQLIAEDPGPEVVEAAERILDQGFRSAGVEATL